MKGSIGMLRGHTDGMADRGEFEAVFSQFGKIEHACLLSMLDSLGRRR
jgi:hypothetical protein